jgi:hypothetical protein
MKKIIYIAILALVSSLAITSCTEENVTPKQQVGDAAGGASDPLK